MQTENRTRNVSPDNLILIPGGKFMMGSDKFYPEEKPVHEVTVDAFHMDKYEVTNADYKKFVEENFFSPNRD